jgi:prepilin-type N-terminal cleavage/methylation domain-containing protein
MGFTLVEVLVTLIVSGILIVIASRTFRDFNHSFNLQGQISERDMNGHFALKRLSEALMEAGANLPTHGWNEIVLPEGNPGKRVLITVNPEGGLLYITAPVVSVELTINDPEGFHNASSILVVPEDKTAVPYSVDIDSKYNANGFVNGIKASPTSTVFRFSSTLNLAVSDAVYACDTEDYRLIDNKLMLDDMVLAEDIDDISFTFYSSEKKETDKWSEMRSGRIEVISRTRLPDPHLDKNGGYRKLTLSTGVLLRNKL